MTGLQQKRNNQKKPADNRGPDTRNDHTNFYAFPQLLAAVRRSFLVSEQNSTDAIRSYRDNNETSCELF